MAANDGSRRAQTGGCNNLVTASVPGEWPATPASDELRERYHHERARREITLGAIRAELEEQPSRLSIRICARRWCVEITNLAEAVAAARENTEPAE